MGTVRCTQCGLIDQVGTTICRRCGTATMAMRTEMQPVAETVPHSSVKLWVIGIAFLMAFGGLLVVGARYSSQPGGTTASVTPQNEVPTERGPAPDISDAIVAKQFESAAIARAEPAIVEQRKSLNANEPGAIFDVDADVRVPIPTTYSGEKVWLVPVQLTAVKNASYRPNHTNWWWTDYAVVRSGSTRSSLSSEQVKAAFGDYIDAETPDGSVVPVKVAEPYGVRTIYLP